MISAMTAYNGVSAARANGNVDGGILRNLRETYGQKAPLASFNDYRFTRMRGYLIEGLEYPGYNPATALGEGWTMEQPDQYARGQVSFILAKEDEPSSCSQRLTFNRVDNECTLVSSTMIKTHHLNMDSNGKVSSETAY